MKKNFLFHIIILLFILTSNGSKATIYFYQGGSITTLSSWNTLLNGTGGAPTTFTGSHTWNFHNNTTTASLGASWGISANAAVNIGDATNAFTLTLNSGATIGTANTQINIKNNGTLIDNIAYSFNVSKTNPNNGSTIVFASNSAQILAFVNAYHNVIIDADVNLNAVNITVNGTLTINSGKSLSLNNLNLIINGKIAGAGEIVGDNGGSSGITFNTATGNIGTLLFQAGSEVISNLNINLGSSSSSVTLGTNLVIDGGTAQFNNGGLALNGNSLQIAASGAVDFSGGGVIFGSSTSALEVDGSITGSLMMDATDNNLAGLILNSNGNTLQVGNTLNITDSILVVDGTLDVNGNVTLKASGTKTAYTGSVGATGSITGNITVESNFPAGNTGWALLGVNGITGQTIANLDGQIPMTCNGCIYGQNALGAWFNSVQSWDEPNCDYDTVITSATSMSPGKGFWVYLGNSSPSGTTPAMTWAFTGPLKQGSFTVPMSANFSCGTSTTGTTYGITDGSNLLANPYACPISWEKLYNLGSNSTDLSSASVFYWNRTNVAAADYNAASHAGTGGGTDIIPAGEGFYVENGFGTSLAFDESVKTNANTTAMFRPAASQLNLLRLRVTGKYDTDDAVFTLIPNATVGYDKYDTHKKFSSPGYGGSTGGSYGHYTSISTLNQATGKYLSINGFPPTSYSVAIPVLVRVSTTGSYTINAEDFANYGSCAVIKDKLTNVYHDLKVSPYVFNISDTTNTPRFELIVCESGGGGIVSVKDLYSSTNISIAQVNGVPVVKTVFPQSTDVVISVYNVLGQQLLNDIKVSGSETTTNLSSLNMHGQVVLVKVTAGNQSAIKKLILD
ncbi:MAG: hypothetical protein IT236_05385 [Bacteroidia bacterium]|nr:hypothetical protein [Bacteroidia bacterium]